MTQTHHSSDGPVPPPGCPAHSGPAGSGKEPGAVPLYGPRFRHNPAQLYWDIRREHGPVAPIVLEG
ncbi:MAG: hypothetical protein QOI83_1172, partial [Streptomycetaceae bacterium]|nr:hypothetical protein [Streptomycetaceae bacterium]